MHYFFMFQTLKLNNKNRITKKNKDWEDCHLCHGENTLNTFFAYTSVINATTNRIN